MASPRGRKHYKKPGQEGLFRRGVVFSGQRHADHKDKNDHRVAEQGDNRAGTGSHYVSRAGFRRKHTLPSGDDPAYHRYIESTRRLMRPNAHEEVIEGASPEAIENFKAMQEQAAVDDQDHRVKMTLLARITQRIRELIGG